MVLNSFCYSKNMGKKGVHQKTARRRVGNVGEDLACRYLTERGFTIVERNHNQRWGEIDVIAQKDNRIHFVEVKTIRKTLRQIKEGEGFDARENLSSAKISKLIRTCEMYVQELHMQQEWQLDGLIVSVDLLSKVAHIQELPNLSL